MYYILTTILMQCKSVVQDNSCTIMYKRKIPWKIMNTVIMFHLLSCIPVILWFIFLLRIQFNQFLFQKQHPDSCIKFLGFFYSCAVCNLNLPGSSVRAKLSFLSCARLESTRFCVEDSTNQKKKFSTWSRSFCSFCKHQEYHWKKQIPQTWKNHYILIIMTSSIERMTSHALVERHDASVSVVVIEKIFDALEHFSREVDVSLSSLAVAAQALRPWNTTSRVKTNRKYGTLK